MKIRAIACLLALPVLVLAAACGGGAEQPADTAEPAAEAPAAVENPGTITGTVQFTGTAPEAEVIQMSADPFCMQAHAEAVSSQRVLVNEDGTLRNAFVWIKEGVSGSFPTPEETAQLDQDGCIYHPHVIGIQAGQALEILNSDNTLHNINAQPANNPAFNIAQPVQGMTSDRTFPNQEVMIPVKCDVHPWMNAYIGVVAHPYFAVSDGSGSFTLENVPPGDYVVEAWHETLGTQTQNVTVEPDGSAEISFSFGD